ncbi:MAG: hypothetical protein Q3990_07595, partial [Desulfovibrionaceae bacterium]|nr:hypothetical protein [Desulfovibrionaceae bacterium]
LTQPVPVIGMGHLFAGGISLDGKRDGEGQFVCGTLGAIDAGPLSSRFDYLALGHIHSPRSVAGIETIRYSGSPLAMDFGESQPEKKIVLIELEDSPDDVQDDARDSSAKASGWQGTVQIEEVPVPCFRKLIQLAGSSIDDLESRVQEICDAEAGEEKPYQELLPWLLVDYTGSTPPADWRERIQAKTLLPESGRAICSVVAMRDYSQRRVSWCQDTVSDLKALEPKDVFELVLKSYDVADEDKDMMRALFQQLVSAGEEEDGPVAQDRQPEDLQAEDRQPEDPQDKDQQEAEGQGSPS